MRGSVFLALSFAQVVPALFDGEPVEDGL